MTPETFAAALRARGIELVLRRNRLAVWPVRAYSHGLSDAERAYIPLHRAELRALVRGGLPEATVPWRESSGPEPPGAAPKPDVLACPFCYRAPCIGRGHPAFDTLHAPDAQEQQRRHTEQRERDKKEWEMRQRFGLPSPRWT